MKRLLATAATLVVTVASVVLFVGTSAEAASHCGGKQAVGHGISLSPCITSANGSINEVIWGSPAFEAGLTAGSRRPPGCRRSRRRPRRRCR